MTYPCTLYSLLIGEKKNLKILFFFKNKNSSCLFTPLRTSFCLHYIPKHQNIMETFFWIINQKREKFFLVIFLGHWQTNIINTQIFVISPMDGWMGWVFSNFFFCWEDSKDYSQYRNFSLEVFLKIANLCARERERERERENYRISFESLDLNWDFSFFFFAFEKIAWSMMICDGKMNNPHPNQFLMEDCLFVCLSICNEICQFCLFIGILVFFISTIVVLFAKKLTFLSFSLFFKAWFNKRNTNIIIIIVIIFFITIIIIVITIIINIDDIQSTDQ